MIPNILTILRILLTPIIVYFILTDSPIPALFLFILASLSDWADGFIARRFNLESKLGAILDPMADKILVTSLYITFTYLEIIPIFVMLPVLLRDFLISLCFWHLKKRNIQFEVKPSRVSKINTALQLIYILAAYVFYYRTYIIKNTQETFSMPTPTISKILSFEGSQDFLFSPFWHVAQVILIILVLTFTFISAYDYTKTYLKMLKGQKL